VNRAFALYLLNRVVERDSGLYVCFVCRVFHAVVLMTGRANVFSNTIGVCVYGLCVLRGLFFETFDLLLYRYLHVCMLSHEVIAIVAASSEKSPPLHWHSSF